MFSEILAVYATVCLDVHAEERKKKLLEAAASEQVASVFRLGCGTEPLFSHLSAWFDPPAEVAGGGWHRDMQYVFPDEGGEKKRLQYMLM